MVKYVLLFFMGGSFLISQAGFAEDVPFGVPIIHGDEYITDEDLVTSSGDSLTTTVGNTTPVQVYNEYLVDSAEHYYSGPNLGVDFWDDYRRPRFGGYSRDWERRDGFGRHDDSHFDGFRGPGSRPFGDGHSFGNNHSFGEHGRGR